MSRCRACTRRRDRVNDLISGQHAHPATALPSPYPPPLRHNPDIPAGNCIVVGTQEGVHARASRVEGSKVRYPSGEACPISLSSENHSCSLHPHQHTVIFIGSRHMDLWTKICTRSIRSRRSRYHISDPPQVLRFTTVSQSGELHGPMEIPLEVEALLRGEGASHQSLHGPMEIPLEVEALLRGERA